MVFEQINKISHVWCIVLWKLKIDDCNLQYQFLISNMYNTLNEYNTVDRSPV